MIELKNKVVPDAYHGTSRAFAENIVRTGRFEPSSGRYCYLGDGVYFFEAGKSHARWWARKKYGTNIAIILATIQLGRCLDMGDPDYIKLIDFTRRKMEKLALNRELSDTLIINFLTTKIDKEIETVRGYFHGSHERIFPESKIYDITHVVICVKKHENILNFELL